MHPPLDKFITQGKAQDPLLSCALIEELVNKDDKSNYQLCILWFIQ